VVFAMVDNRGPVTLAVTVTMLILATVFVFFRFVTRIWIVRKVYLDDWLILVAWALAVGFSASICEGTGVGLGLHEVDIAVGDHGPLRKAEYSFSVLYNPALMVRPRFHLVSVCVRKLTCFWQLTKTSILVFFLSLSKDELLFRRLNYLTLLVVNVAGTALTLLNIFQCRPPQAAFTYPVPKNSSCTDIVTLYLSSAPVNIITDLAILLLPMPLLTGMRLPKKQKIILVATFSAGAFVAVVDVVRLAYLQDAAFARLSAQTGESGDNTTEQRGDDFSWNAALSFMWSAVEVNLGLICACVPSLKPLFLRFLPSFIKDESDTSLRDSIDDRQENALKKSAPAGNLMTNPAAFRAADPKEKEGAYGGEGGFLDFLSGPDDDLPVARTGTNVSKVSAGGSNFDFYKMESSKNMLKLTNSQSVRPVAIVTILFFLWGFAYGLLDVLNSQFQRVVGTTAGEGLGLHAAYFGGYFVGPLTLGRFILKKYGFKAAMIAGLAVYGCGTLVFWPSSVLGSYEAFIVSNFIVGFGLSCLEISANPYIALCGPLEYAEVRLNLSQGFQAIGGILSPLLASRVLFKSANSAPSLIQVQWTYLGIALFGWALALAFYYVNLPEASDEELDELADKNLVANQTKIGPFRVIWVTLAIAVSSQFFYVGAQEAAGNNFRSLFALANPNRSSDYVTVGHTVFAAGRFLSAFLNYVLKPRWILLVLYLASIVSCALAMNLGGEASVAAGQLIYLFESGIFAVIFCIGLRGLGIHTKTGSAFLTAAISGGAIFPVIQAAAERARGVRYGFCVALAAFAVGTVLAIYLNVMSAAKKQVDPVHEDRMARRNRRLARNHSNQSDSSETKNQFGLMGIIARRKRAKADNIPTSEHLENGSPTRRDSPNSSTNEAESMDTEKIEVINPPSRVRTQEPVGIVGDLRPWPPSPVEEREGLKHDLAPWPGDGAKP
jgi:fucose permease